MPLVPMGTLIKADENGGLPRLGRAPHPSWKLILEDVIQQLQRHAPHQEFSVIVRGSVARGVTVAQAADLDLVILHDGDFTPPLHLQTALVPDLKIEAPYIPMNAFAVDDDLAGMRFMLAHSGHTIWGRDVLLDLADPQLGGHCYAHLPNADQWLGNWEVFWQRDKDYHAICQWLMKRIVRALFESQMIRINAYTRDIYPCAQVAKEAFLDQRTLIQTASELAVEPVADRGLIDEIVAPLSETLLLQRAALEPSFQTSQD